MMIHDEEEEEQQQQQSRNEQNNGSVSASAAHAANGDGDVGVTNGDAGGGGGGVGGGDGGAGGDYTVVAVCSSGVEESAASSDGRQHQHLHEPQLSVRVTGVVAPLTKNGDSSYTIEVTQNVAPYSSHSIIRLHSELEMLQRYLSSLREDDLTRSDLPIASHDRRLKRAYLDSVIVPPLPPPPRPLSDRPILSSSGKSDKNGNLKAASAAADGDKWDVLGNDAIYCDCRPMERWLQLVLDQPWLSKSSQLRRFLLQKDGEFDTNSLVLPSSGYDKAVSLFVSFVRKIEWDVDSFADRDPYLHRYRVWLRSYLPALTDVNSAFAALLSSQQRVCFALSHLATALLIGTGWNTSVHGVYQRLCGCYSDNLLQYQRDMQLVVASGEGALSPILQLYTGYTTAENDMLERRIRLMLDFKDSEKIMLKVSGQMQKKDAAIRTDAAFAHCTNLVTSEVVRLRHLRCTDMLEGLCDLARKQVTYHQRVQNQLAASIADLKSITLES